ncbi:peptide-methionine (S)-S-oxide reductase MsrA [Pontibacter sp. SGAir0037]|uniref:peptide-methionine (S)-S-oxide reductase MsrA n=1 Tax=Pontibacter sp. SGAir0037 TaxID=2571030 RepID=UPI0010CD2016|nr:peptide-methionine (S)-S-oxide reductase MsrA [Pontibacter sp. SGAir0037]QCR21890.1 peptide-methionine (S)-S-oxide reductase [Pontibacter sp. SGAir0037]
MLHRIIWLMLPQLFWLVSCSEASTGEKAPTQASASLDEAIADSAKLEKATFAGGCFWCTEAFFERLKGVKKVVSGYAGGHVKNPTYQQVSAGTTGHAECVQIYYDPQLLTYQDLLEVFFATHDPTTLNRQGPDVGEQYRSAIFYHNQEQKQQAEQYISSLESASGFLKKVVTKVEPLKAFYEAEDYHQDFYRQNPDNVYMQRVAEPKMDKFEQKFKDKLKN